MVASEAVASRMNGFCRGACLRVCIRGFRPGCVSSHSVRFDSEEQPSDELLGQEMYGSIDLLIATLLEDSPMDLLTVTLPVVADLDIVTSGDEEEAGPVDVADSLPLEEDDRLADSEAFTPTLLDSPADLVASPLTQPRVDLQDRSVFDIFGL